MKKTFVRARQSDAVYRILKLSRYCEKESIYCSKDVRKGTISASCNSKFKRTNKNVFCFEKYEKRVEFCYFVVCWVTSALGITTRCSSIRSVISKRKERNFEDEWQTRKSKVITWWGKRYRVTFIQYFRLTDIKREVHSQKGYIGGAKPLQFFMKITILHVQLYA